MTDNWPFDDPQNVATFTLQQIVNGETPVLLVNRDADDGSWQFLDGKPVSMANAVLVTLSSMLERDPTIAELADLPAGWEATRANRHAAWQRRQVP